MREAADMEAAALRGVPPTYIPMKNLVYYGLAASYAEETGAGCIVGGHNKEDMRVFDDTSELFFAQLQRALWSGSSRLRGNQTRIVRPLRKLTKAEVVLRAASLGVPLQLTWSCHRDGSRHCWECEGCEARAKAFIDAGLKDPLTSKKV
jgi:7-cyano-7-deazaguanine synthase